MASLDQAPPRPPFALIATVTAGFAALGGAALAFWVFLGGTLTLDLASVFCL